jgi:hypothetical protein
MPRRRAASGRASPAEHSLVSVGLFTVPANRGNPSEAERSLAFVGLFTVPASRGNPSESDVYLT